MKEDFNRIAIAIDTDAQTRFKSQVRIKQRHINELYQLVTPFVAVQDKSTLQGNFYNQFIELFLAKYQSKFPPISVHKMLEAMEVNTARIDEITKEIEAIDISLDQELNAVEPDFNIYTETEDQNKLYKALEKVCNDLNQLHTMGVRLTPQNLQQGTNRALLYDWSEKTMKPNIRRVLGNERG
jgi:translation initiation factor 2 alpha subunit (eIF-2alpha)